MKITSCAVAVSLLLLATTAHSMYQQAGMPYDAVDQQAAIEFGPFQSYQRPVPSAPAAEPTLQQQIVRRSRLKSLLLAPERQAEHRELVESIGSSHAASVMSLGLFLMLGCNHLKDFYFTPASGLINHDKITYINLLADSLLNLAAIGAAVSLERKTKKAEAQLINLLHRLDGLSEGAAQLTPAQHTTHPSYTRYRSLCSEDDTIDQTSLEQQAPLSALQIQHAKDISVLKELGSLDTQRSMWILMSLLFAAQALKDSIYYSDRADISTITTTISGVGSIVSLLLAAYKQDELDQQEEVATAHIQDVTTVHEEI